jgi:hypothetical protein
MSQRTPERAPGGARPNEPGAPDTRPYGIGARFVAVETFIAACEKVRDAGYHDWDAFAPYPVHGLNDAMGIKHSKLPLVVLGAAVTGAGGAILLQWWMNAHNYPLVISGKPLFSLPANIPIMFELTVLFSAIAAFIGMLAFNNLPMLHHPVLNSPSFDRVTTDTFLIVIETKDPSFDEKKTRALLESAGGDEIAWIEE